jgi:hypothetical protein
MLPKFYQTHLQKQLTHTQVMLLTILRSCDTIGKKSEIRTARTPYFPIQLPRPSRRRKLQRFLDIPQLTISLIWFPLIAYWLTTYCSVGQSLSIPIAPMSIGVYKYVHVKRSYPEGNRLDLAEKSHSIILVASYPN